MDPALNDLVISRGSSLYGRMSRERPALFDAGTWIGRLMEWALSNEDFKMRLFRFVDVFPSLTTSRQITDHIRQYFGDAASLPPFLSGGASLAGSLGPIGESLLARTVAAQIHDMARQFIIAENTNDLVKRLASLRNDGFAAVVDLLGEATLSDEEAESYVATCLELLDALAAARRQWHPLGAGGGDGMDWPGTPMINMAVKATALCCRINPLDFEGSVTEILSRLRRICRRTTEVGGFLCLDMESYRFRGIVLEAYRRLKLEFPEYTHIGIVLQAYLKESEHDLEGLLAWGEQHRTPLSIRLVKGAYWDYEVATARQAGREPPVYLNKNATDAAFERMAAAILARHNICHLACASHNIRSIAAVLETARHLGVPESRYEFQMLYGMAEPVRRVLLRETGRLRLYTPYGPLVPGIGYLVRRLLENSSNESFLRRSFKAEPDITRLLTDPAAATAETTAAAPRKEPSSRSFANHPAADFSDPAQRDSIRQALRQVSSRIGLVWPLHIDGHDLRTEMTLPDINPNQPSQQLGLVCQAGEAEVLLAVRAAKAAFPAWRDTPLEQRAAYLRKAAAAARKRICELAAWQILEIGKQWDQAHADVAEAIDFLEYYAGEILRTGAPRPLMSLPGEENILVREPYGVAAVIAPWNFPLAIAAGMTAAALATGNTVVFKPSGLTGITGRHLTDLFREAGLPAGVLNFVPGPGQVVGELLSGHPDVSLIAFTGSGETGLRILEQAARVQPGQAGIKKVISEMGGKNAIIIDDDADLDEAIPQLLASAFGFQGQKCSACSRVIVLDGIHDRFIARLVPAVRAWRIGPAEDPSFSLGAVAEQAAVEKIRRYHEIGLEEGTLLYESQVPQQEGYWVPICIFTGIRPEHRLAQEEIFGPILSIMRAADFEQALRWANSTPYALTGGLFSRSPKRIRQARQEFRVGNLYINRAITGAMAGRQPFGGSGMSGGGTKAGGDEYLLHFLQPRVITENSMRRGFAPENRRV